jgi:hypothetical protein
MHRRACWPGLWGRCGSGSAPRETSEVLASEKHGRCQATPLPIGHANGRVRGLVLPATCPTGFASECVFASTAPPKDGAGKADTALTSRQRDGHWFRTPRVKAFAAVQQIPYSVAMNDRNGDPS